MLKNTKLYSLLLCLLLYSSGCHAVTHIILDDPIELNQVEAHVKVITLALHQLTSLEETGKLIEPKDLGLPVGHITRYYTFEMQIKGKDFRIWTTPKKYGRNGKVSYYFDTATCRIHGKDKKGEKANSEDPIVDYEVADKFKEHYPCSQGSEEEMGETELGWQSWYVDHRTNKDMAVWKLVQDDHH